MARPDACLDRRQARAMAPETGLERAGDGDGRGVGPRGPSGAPAAVTFRVEGMAPAPQGSKDWLPNGGLKESCKNVKPWRLLVAKAFMAQSDPTCVTWKDWQWVTWSALHQSPGLTATELLKRVGPRRHKITLVDVHCFLPVLAACMAKQKARLLRGPVRMSVVFVFTRPAGHFRKDDSLKPSAPAHHAVKPDGSKLLRSTEDALTGLAFEDDARIVGCTWDKRYAVGDEQAGALITVIPLT